MRDLARFAGWAGALLWGFVGLSVIGLAVVHVSPVGFVLGAAALGLGWYLAELARSA